MIKVNEEKKETVDVWCSRCVGKRRRGGVARFSKSGTELSQWLKKHRHH